MIINNIAYKKWVGICVTMVVAGLFGSACATHEATVPFHMYSSPLIEAPTNAQYPRARNYDPFLKGDHELSNTVFVYESSGSKPPESSSTQDLATAPDTVTKHTPPVAPKTSPQTAAGAPGGVATEITQARPSKPTRSPAKKMDIDTQKMRRQAQFASQFVFEIYHINAITLPERSKSNITELYKTCKDRGAIHHRNQPVIGDIVFFHNTFDANADGRNNDWYSYVGLVEFVHPNGLVEILAFKDSGVQSFKLHLEHPEQNDSNSTLRTSQPTDAPHTQYLAGQLFAGFCSLLGEKAEFLVVDNWTPDMKLIH